MTDTLSGRAVARAVQVAPLLIGPANAVAATGLPWRWISEHAAALGVAFVGTGRKRAVKAGDFIAALERSGIEASDDGTPPVELAPIDAAEHIRRALGVRRRA